MSSEGWITICAIAFGPLVAILISLWVDGRRSKREAKLALLRVLLSTRDLASDPNYQIAIQLIPINFHDDRAVLTALSEFIDAANAPYQGKSDNELRQITENTSMKMTRLLYEMGKTCGLKLRESDIHTRGYTSRGFLLRDQLLQDSQRAMRDVANILWMQTRLMAGEKWEDVSRMLSENSEGEDQGAQ